MVLKVPFALSSGTVVQIGVSIGLALAQSEDTGADALVWPADVALYQAKADGLDRFCFFEPCMDTHIQARASIESVLRQAVADDLIIPYFQPLIAMGTERLLRSACRIAMTWPPDILLACNVSPFQLRDRGLPAMIRAALDETGLPPHRLELEITESALVGDLDLARDLLGELKALGARLAFDDFGTGYSSLRHLNMLPFDKLKIDASFVGAMVGNLESRKIVAAVVGLGHSLGLITVAEDVEEPETAALLRDLGCDIGQGCLFGRPGSAEAVGMLSQHRRTDWVVDVRNPFEAMA